MSSGPRSCSLLRMGFRVMHPAGVPAKRWHMTLLWQRGAACRWHPCCPYGAPSLHNLSDWLSASLGAVKAGSGSPLQQPGHPFRWQQRHCCSDITVPRHGHTCPDVCERRPGGALGSYGNLLRKRGGRRYNAEQAAPGSGGKKAAPFLSEMLASGRFRLCGAAICFFGLILRSGFRAWERRSGHLQN